MQVRPDAFVELLLNDVACKQMKVTKVLHVLQNESPDADLHSLPLLKDFLEAILSDKKMLSDVDSSVLVLLVKIYLKRLLESRNKNGATSNTFSGSVCSFAVLFGSRPAWLNEMPPFNGKGISRTCTLSQKCNKEKVNGQEVDCCCWSCNEDLLRLQSLLSYLGPSDEVKELVLDFLCSAKEKKPSWLSLDVMCSSEAQAIKILIGMAPKALLPYAKEIIKADEKKWCMLFTLLHEHMKSLPEDHPLFEVYLETFHSVLAHLAETLKPVELLGLLPQEKDPIFVPYVKRCVDKHQANLLKDKIVSLGQEIKSMMLS
ncbi:uncharacterized protein LOC118191360 isoform X1 [Stegodyphus dumicola]|uniref:uncharacterized protein LOC118191360 isoform X1 n=1 Tax=Stegodyphus dumicola TaxID=202533 RepID=UPI0015AAC4E5|nr:uncharacterized protein LOC118191360 isoform X1 [Stegodyphus dumicola]